LAHREIGLTKTEQVFVGIAWWDELRTQQGPKNKDPHIELKGSGLERLSNLSVLIALILMIFPRRTALLWIALKFFPTSGRASFLFVAL